MYFWCCIRPHCYCYSTLGDLLLRGSHYKQHTRRGSGLVPIIKTSNPDEKWPWWYTVPVLEIHTAADFTHVITMIGRFDVVSHLAIVVLCVWTLHMSEGFNNWESWICSCIVPSCSGRLECQIVIRICRASTCALPYHKIVNLTLEELIQRGGWVG